MRNFEVRDSRNGEWSWVYNALISDPHLTPVEKVVYASLATFAGMKEIRPGYDKIALKSSVSRRSAINAIKKLIDIGFVAIDEEGTGRHKTNLYILLKMPKGCKLCTISKKVQTKQEKVQITTQKGAGFAPNKDIEKDIEKDTIAATPLEEKFNWLEYHKKVLNDKQRHVRIIAKFWVWRYLKFETKNQAEMNIARNVRPARQLCEYPDDKIEATMQWLHDNADFKWELSTVLKHIDYDLKKLKPYAKNLR